MLGYFLEKSVHVILPGNEIPKWFRCQSVGSSTSITLEISNKNRSVLGFAFSAVVSFGDHHVDCGSLFGLFGEFEVKPKDCGPHVIRIFLGLIWYVESDHLLLGYYFFNHQDFISFGSTMAFLMQWQSSSILIKLMILNVWSVAGWKNVGCIYCTAQIQQKIQAQVSM